MWNPLEALKRKMQGGVSAEPTREAVAAVQTAVQQAPLEDLQKKGLLGKFFRHWKDPAMMQQLRGLISHMQAAGVDVKNKAAVQDWIKAHQKEIEAGQFADAPAAAKPRTFVKTSPEVGRNDPCPCGSGKKYKKCCEGKKA